MFTRFEIKIGLRYLKAKQKNSFVSFISIISIIGIALGVAALITVLSVMNGFQRDIRAKIIGISSHMQITDASGILQNWQEIGEKTKINSQIINYAPYVDGNALINFEGNVNGVLVRGIIPKYEMGVNNIANTIVKGSYNSLAPSSFKVLVGVELAKQLGVGVGDKITIITPDGQSTPAGIIPRLKQFTISGIFNTHMYQYDSSMVYINLNDAQILFKMNNGVSGLRLKVKDLSRTVKNKEELEKVLPTNIMINDWIDQHQDYFAAVEMEKKMMSIILTLIVAVAAFNLVSTLVMTVNEKKSDIAILRTMGASKKNIMNIFIIQGGLAGIIGTITGTVLGIILANYIGRILHFIEKFTHSKIINGTVYNIDYLPSHIVFSDVAIIFLVSISLSFLATLYPSRSAAKIDPAEALRYE